jgi:hypothetical protein
MRLAFPGETTAPVSQTEASAMMESVAQWYRESSYQKLSIQTDVTGLLTLPESRSWYGERALTILLDHARAAAAGAGFDPGQYHLDIARHTPVPGWEFSGLGLSGQKGLWLQLDHVGVIIHELGHNLGLSHANVWSAGEDSIIGPGQNAEYGNVFDPMGIPEAYPGSDDFGVYWKRQLNWLSAGQVRNVTLSGTYRLFASDSPATPPGQFHALRIQKDEEREYWVEFRQRLPNDPWLRDGVIVSWAPWSGSRGGTQMLDMNPGADRSDAPLTVGRTFSDFLDRIHLTPLRVGGAGTNRWVDMHVVLGATATNRSPQLQLSGGQSPLSPGQEAAFSALATDSDGDPLAYSWDFGDGSRGGNTNAVRKAWTQSGRYVVTCLATDMKGGVSRAQVVVAVGVPASFMVQGRVVDAAGTPLMGVRVHNGQTGADYRGSETDSRGYYAIPNLSAGSYEFQAVEYGYSVVPALWMNPIIISSDRTNLHWLAVEHPTVTLVAVDEFASELSSNDTAVVRFSRTGPTDSSLAVKYSLGGTALMGTDYQVEPVTTGPGYQLQIPAGASSADLRLLAKPDAMTESTESITITLVEDLSYRLLPSRRATVWLKDPDPTGNSMPIATADIIVRYVPAGAEVDLATLLSNDRDPDQDGILFLAVDAVSSAGGELFRLGDTLYYTAPVGWESDDSFRYSISDGRGGVATATVTVDARHVPSPRLDVSMSGPLVLVEGMDGVPGVTYRIEFSSQLGPGAEWKTVTSVTSDAAGQFRFEDFRPTDGLMRIYRSVFP